MKEILIGSIAVLHSDGRLEAKTYGLKLELPADADEDILKLYDESGRSAIARKVQELRDETGAQVEYRVTHLKEGTEKATLAVIPPRPLAWPSIEEQLRLPKIELL